MARRLIVAVMISGMLVGVAASSAGASAATSFTKKEACKLVTAGDIEAAFGAAPTETTKDGKAGKFTTCTWKVPSASGDATAFVGIDKTNSLNSKDYGKRSKSPTAEKVPGIKKGFIDGNTLTFVKNGNFVNVQYLGATPAETNADGLVAVATELNDKL